MDGANAEKHSGCERNDRPRSPAPRIFGSASDPPLVYALLSFPRFVSPFLPLLLIAWVAVGCGPLTGTVAGRLPATGLGEPAPALALTDVRTGEPVHLADFAGRAVLLNAWATWCAPCRAEMPALDSLQRERPDGLAVVFVSDEPPELLRAWLADRATEGVYAHADLESFVGPYAAVQGARPVSFVIDDAGVLRERIVGAQTADAFRQRLDALP